MCWMDKNTWCAQTQVTDKAWMISRSGSWYKWHKQVCSALCKGNRTTSLSFTFTPDALLHGCHRTEDTLFQTGYAGNILRPDIMLWCTSTSSEWLLVLRNKNPVVQLGMDTTFGQHVMPICGSVLCISNENLKAVGDVCGLFWDY